QVVPRVLVLVRLAVLELLLPLALLELHAFGGELVVGRRDGPRDVDVGVAALHPDDRVVEHDAAGRAVLHGHGDLAVAVLLADVVGRGPGGGGRRELRDGRPGRLRGRGGRLLLLLAGREGDSQGERGDECALGHGDTFVIGGCGGRTAEF